MSASDSHIPSSRDELNPGTNFSEFFTRPSNETKSSGRLERLSQEIVNGSRNLSYSMGLLHQASQRLSESSNAFSKAISPRSKRKPLPRTTLPSPWKHSKAIH